MRACGLIIDIVFVSFWCPQESLELFKDLLFSMTEANPDNIWNKLTINNALLIYDKSRIGKQMIKNFVGENKSQIYRMTMLWDWWQCCLISQLAKVKWKVGCVLQISPSHCWIISQSLRGSQIHLQAQQHHKLHQVMPRLSWFLSARWKKGKWAKSFKYLPRIQKNKDLR